MITLNDCETLAGHLLEFPEIRPPWLLELTKRSLNPGDEGLYYRFFSDFVKWFGPGVRVWEIGTNLGCASAHFAVGNPTSVVTTVDINPDAAIQTRKLGLKNITAITGDSMQILPTEPQDILFIDGNHTFNQAYSEYVRYRPFVRNGGFIFFDDISLPMATWEMHVLWDCIRDPKMRLDNLHNTGFGAVKVDHTISVPLWGDVIGVAELMMRQYQEKA